MEQLCWSCDKSRGGENGCCWFNGFEPVEGWKAEKNCRGYLVHKCPLYTPDTTMQKPLKLIEEGGWNYIKVEDLANLLGMKMRTFFRQDLITLKKKALQINYNIEVAGKSSRRAFFIKEIHNENDRG